VKLLLSSFLYLAIFTLSFGPGVVRDVPFCHPHFTYLRVTLTLSYREQ
jgi:hypothetical protein